MLLHCCNLPSGPLCQSPILPGTSLDGLCFTHSGWLCVLPAVFLHKAPWSHAKICFHSLAWHPGSGRITNHKGQNIPPGTSAVHQDTDHLPWQLRVAQGSELVWALISREVAQQWQRLAARGGDQCCSPWQRKARLSPGEENEVQEAAAYGLVFWISPTNLYSKPAISVVAMETKVLEYNETHVWMLLPPLSVHHSAFLDSEGKDKGIRVISLVVAPEV